MSAKPELSNIANAEFITSLFTATKTHDQWLTVVKFGLNTLLENQVLFSEILALETDRMRSDDKMTRLPGYYLAKILEELKLKLIVAE